MIILQMMVVIVLFSLIVIVSSLAGLGIGLAKKTFDPYYLFIKQLNIYDFITRIEFVIVAAWNIGMFLKISLLLYLAIISFAQVWKIKRRKFLIVLVIPMLFLTLIYTNILKSAVLFNVLESHVLYINLIFLFAIPLAMIIVFFLKKIKGKVNCNV